MKAKHYILTKIGAFVALPMWAVFGAGCESGPTHTQRGAAQGAAAGAVLGGVVGHQSGEMEEGAAIGAAVGGAAGAASGSRHDRDERARDNQSFSDDYYRSLLTDEEVETLQARARESGRRDYDIVDFLTAEEKENLRRRADNVSEREIGN